MCFCGNRRAQWGRLNLSPTASQLPQNMVWGCPPFPVGQLLCQGPQDSQVLLERQRRGSAPHKPQSTPTPGGTLGSTCSIEFKPKD